MVLCVKKNEEFPISGFPRMLFRDHPKPNLRPSSSAADRRWRTRTPSQQKRRRKWTQPQQERSNYILPHFEGFFDTWAEDSGESDSDNSMNIGILNWVRSVPADAKAPTITTDKTPSTPDPFEYNERCSPVSLFPEMEGKQIHEMMDTSRPVELCGMGFAPSSYIKRTSANEGFTYSHSIRSGISHRSSHNSLYTATSHNSIEQPAPTAQPAPQPAPKNEPLPLGAPQFSFGIQLPTKQESQLADRPFTYLKDSFEEWELGASEQSKEKEISLARPAAPENIEFTDNAPRKVLSSTRSRKPTGFNANRYISRRHLPPQPSAEDYEEDLSTWI